MTTNDLAVKSARVMQIRNLFHIFSVEVGAVCASACVIELFYKWMSFDWLYLFIITVI